VRLTTITNERGDERVGARFEGKVAVITGGASGIGRATAARLVAEGARVVLGDVDEAGLAATVDELGGEKAAHGVRCDVTVEADVEALVAVAGERFGGLHLAVNCAGVGTLAPIPDHPVEEWDRVVDICLKGVFLAVKHEARVMRDGGGGAIVNLASINARLPAEGMVAYCSAKAAVEMLTRCAAMELGPHAIRVAGVGPGLVATPLTSFTQQVPALGEGYRRNTPLGRTGTVDDVSAAVCWLLSGEASWVSGDTLYIDGGALTREYPRFFDILATQTNVG
jgi:NAD(P)-dependent dehydrogenase (short-subunit alcohol dehydrogenase family)